MAAAEGTIEAIRADGLAEAVAQARRMEEAALRDDGRTPEERAHRMAEAAVLMGQAARRAEATGEERMLRGGSYRGEGTNGRQHALGVLRRHRNASLWYEGEWRNGEWNGLGVNWYHDGSIYYSGQWEDGRCHGLGIERNEDGSVEYAGWWNRSRRSGTAPPE
eukprot:GHVU01152548.1.p2 GENE.GHVU01152548.1~~GHVU01152548.1.p2  ORF type:complete len:163 (+),score=26.17 GHVU01152548.1:226-714(+)